MSALTRLAGPKDAAAIADVHADSRQSIYRALAPAALATEPSIQQRIGRWRAWLTEMAEPSFTLIAERQIEPVGFCAITAPSHDSHPDAGIAEVSALYVAPEAWRSGVGHTLLDTALARLRMDGWDAVTAWVLCTNEIARAFYTRFALLPDGAQAQHDLTDVPRVRLRVQL